MLILKIITKLKMLFFILPLSFFLISFETSIAAESESIPPISAELISEIESIQPGQPFWVAIRLNIENHWHSYWKNPGEVGMATSVKWTLPEGYMASQIYWPTPERFDSDSIIGYGYKEKATLLAMITPPDHEGENGNSHIQATVEWLACSSTNCLPGVTHVSLSLPIKHVVPNPSKAGALLIEEAKKQLPAKTYSDLFASKKKDLFEISLKIPGLQSHTADAFFFPDTPGIIDDQTQATFSVGEDGCCIVALRESDSPEEKPANIKGVLVLRDREDQHVLQAIDLDAPLHHDMNDSLVFIENEGESSSASVFFFYLFTAFLGGIILNLMPCVLPVISLKIMSFVKMAGENRRKIFEHGLSFSMGVLVSFWTLAGTLMILQSYGHAVGWGFQLQQPLVIAILSIVILIFALSMFGLFEMGTSIASWAGQAQAGTLKKGEKLSNSFVSGVLATAMATPCTGPFLGPAVGFAVTQPAILGLLVFTSLGLGMASPYLLLSAFPSLLRYMPKPGNWMVIFREITGFILLLVVLWLLWIFGAQTDNLALFLLMASLLLFAFSCWIYGKWCCPVKSKKTRIIGKVVAAFFFLAGGSVAYDSVSKNEVSTVAWKQFHPQKVEESLQQGKPVLVDFTAKWCLICQSNHLAMSAGKVDAKLQELGVVKMKADWTKHDQMITEELKKFGRNGVPLYLLYSGDPNEPPEILPQVLTPDIISDYLDNIKKSVIAENER